MMFVSWSSYHIVCWVLTELGVLKHRTMSTITMGLTVVISHAGVNIIRNNSINKIHADHQTNQYKITSVLHWLQSSLEIDDDPLNVIEFCWFYSSLSHTFITPRPQRSTLSDTDTQILCIPDTSDQDNGAQCIRQHPGMAWPVNSGGNIGVKATRKVTSSATHRFHLNS